MMLAVDVLQCAGRAAVSAESASELLARGGQLVDLRAPELFRHGALPGAMNLPMDALSHDCRHLDRHVPVIVYGAGDVACVRAARLLAGQGFAQIYHLDLAQYEC